MWSALRERKSLQFTLLLVTFGALYTLVAPSDTNILWRLPPLIKSLPGLINDGVDFLLFEWYPVDVYDPEIDEYEKKPLAKEITRSLSGAVLFLIEVVRELLLGGVKTIVAFTSWDWVTANSWAKWPALPWTVVAGGAAILGHALGGTRLAVLTSFSLVNTLVRARCCTRIGATRAFSGGVCIQKPRIRTDPEPFAERGPDHATFFISSAGNGTVWYRRSRGCNCHHYFCHAADGPPYVARAQRRVP